MGAADLVAVHPEALEEPVVVELKVNFSLSLVHQGIARQAISDWVYLAVPTGSGQRWHTSLKANQKLCRRLGLGLIVVRLRDEHVQVVVDPAPLNRESLPSESDCSCVSLPGARVTPISAGRPVGVAP
ncbi:hypothetical protein [Ornithinimicrobium sp. INDO-MA30-4]|uniref:hypothetical protein n=1 Tax=Ornithinimicrobium sp. INDO-MA30-4 TaxID=2908651 RepID=UPI001F3986C9|nr:hypothetical protein [Ornithinimicrobium sp. INDO-MA30-4]UJH70740.1 hypothetical protein L0A91_01375 [Ornithinimicrobium sp. INDO-MA30-4]